MKRKLPMSARRLPVDFGDESVCAVPIQQRRSGRRNGLVSRRSGNGACILDCGSNSSKSLSISLDGNGKSRKSRKSRKSQIVNRKSRGFTLVEILVVLVLLSLIVFALMAVFSGIQRAFRASITQTDSLEGGRNVMNLIANDLAAMTPADGQSNLTNPFQNNYAPVNFYAGQQYSGPRFASYVSPPSPLIQALISSPAGMQRTNILEDIFILGKNNINGIPSWVGTGYSVNTNLPDGTLYPLYRFYMTAPASAGAVSPVTIFNTFVGFQYTNSAVWSHLMDGVVHLVARTYDTNAVWMTNGYTNPLNFGSSFHVKFVRFAPGGNGETDSFFYSNAVPAFVQIEIATLEDHTLQHAESLSGINQSNYLANSAGNVHLFRQRVWIRNLDPTAYQQ